MKENRNVGVVRSPTKAIRCGIAVRDYAAPDDYRQLILLAGIVDAAAGMVTLTPGNNRSVA